MPWPWTRRKAAGPPDAAQQVPARATRSPSVDRPTAAWASLPPLQRTLVPPELTTRPQSFTAGLAAWRNGSLTAGIQRQVGPLAALSGLASHPVGSSAPSPRTAAPAMPVAPRRESAVRTAVRRRPTELGGALPGDAALESSESSLTRAAAEPEGFPVLQLTAEPLPVELDRPAEPEPETPDEPAAATPEQAGATPAVRGDEPADAGSIDPVPDAGTTPPSGPASGPPPDLGSSVRRDATGGTFPRVSLDVARSASSGPAPEHPSESPATGAAAVSPDVAAEPSAPARHVAAPPSVQAAIVQRMVSPGRSEGHSMPMLHRPQPVEGGSPMTAPPRLGLGAPLPSVPDEGPPSSTEPAMEAAPSAVPMPDAVAQRALLDHTQPAPGEVAHPAVRAVEDGATTVEIPQPADRGSPLARVTPTPRTDSPADPDPGPGPLARPDGPTDAIDTQELAVVHELPVQRSADDSAGSPLDAPTPAGLDDDDAGLPASPVSGEPADREPEPVLPEPAGEADDVDLIVPSRADTGSATDVEAAPVSTPDAGRAIDPPAGGAANDVGGPSESTGSVPRAQLSLAAPSGLQIVPLQRLIDPPQAATRSMPVPGASGGGPTVQRGTTGGRSLNEALHSVGVVRAERWLPGPRTPALAASAAHSGPAATRTATGSRNEISVPSLQRALSDPPSIGTSAGGPTVVGTHSLPRTPAVGLPLDPPAPTAHTPLVLPAQNRTTDPAPQVDEPAEPAAATVPTPTELLVQRTEVVPTPGDGNVADLQVGGASAGPAAAAASDPPGQLDELARRLFDPLMLRLRAELLVERERRGLRTDSW